MKERTMREQEGPHGDNRHRRCKRLQFSLRALLGSAMWVALVVGWVLLARNRAMYSREHGFMRIVMESNRQGNAQILVHRTAITIPMQRYMIIRTEEGMGAFKLTEEVNTGDGGVRYRWFFTPHGNRAWTDESTATGEAVVFEQYERRKTPQGYIITDVGSQTRIRCGSIELEWSLGNNIYLPNDAPMAIAYTDQTDIESVSMDDPWLVWCYRLPLPRGK